MEECGYDAYDCATDASQRLPANHVRFACISADESYLNSTFPDAPRENLTCVGRVAVSDASSFISIDLAGIAELGYTVRSIELLDDGNGGSFIPHRFGVFVAVSRLLPGIGPNLDAGSCGSGRFIPRSMRDNRGNGRRRGRE